jgi:hypothetical protein
MPSTTRAVKQSTQTEIANAHQPEDAKRVLDYTGADGE